MAICALVITLSESPGLAHGALRRIAGDERLTLGRAAGSQLAAVLETASDDSDREALEWLQELPGVAQVEIASVFWDDESRESEESRA